MDLIALSKKAIKKPLQPKNFFVLFVMFFIVLIIGLTIILITERIFTKPKLLTGCKAESSKKISGRISSTQDAVYQFNLEENPNCRLFLSLSWDHKDKSTSVWVYKPDGTIDIIEPLLDQATANFVKNGPLEKGKWRLVLKTKDNSALGYSGQISLR